MAPGRKLALFVFVPLAVLIVLQSVPYGRRHVNPPDGVVAAFDSPATQTLAERACFDCHSNRTRWPWYASIAPLSWRIQSHVMEGREALNFTAMDTGGENLTEAAEEAGETIMEGEMPPRDYLLMHPEARLTTAEKQALARGLERTLAPWGQEARREAGGRNAAYAGGPETRDHRDGHERHERRTERDDDD